MWDFSKKLLATVKTASGRWMAMKVQFFRQKFSSHMVVRPLAAALLSATDKQEIR